MNIILILTSVLLGALGQILMKWGIDRPKPLFEVTLTKLHIFLSWPVLLGLFLYGLSAISWILALKRVDLSFAYPMVSLGYVLVVVASYYLFHETISLQRWIGLVIICAGVILISKS